MMRRREDAKELPLHSSREHDSGGWDDVAWQGRRWWPERVLDLESQLSSPSHHQHQLEEVPQPTPWPAQTQRRLSSQWGSSWQCRCSIASCVAARLHRRQQHHPHQDRIHAGTRPVTSHIASPGSHAYPPPNGSSSSSSPPSAPTTSLRSTHSDRRAERRRTSSCIQACQLAPRPRA